MMSKQSASAIKKSLYSAAAGLALIAAYDLARGQETLDTYQYSREAQQGKAITPVNVNLMGKDANLVYLGSYLVNAKGGCNGCHTCPSFSGTNPFAVGGSGLPPGRGGPPATPPGRGAAPGLAQPPTPVNANFFLGGGTPFLNGGKPFQGAVLTAPNLTPNSEGLPGGLTYDDFKNAMVNGTVSTKPGHVLLVMPWPTFRNLYENDLQAIYQYLSAIPPAQSGSCSGPSQTGP
jgi:hypothetical protein